MANLKRPIPLSHYVYGAVATSGIQSPIRLIFNVQIYSEMADFSKTRPIILKYGHKISKRNQQLQDCHFWTSKRYVIRLHKYSYDFFDINTRNMKEFQIYVYLAWNKVSNSFAKWHSFVLFYSRL